MKNLFDNWFNKYTNLEDLEQSNHYTIIQSKEQIFQQMVQQLYQLRSQQSSLYPIEQSFEDIIKLAVQFHQQIAGMDIELQQLTFHLSFLESSQQSSQQTSNLTTQLLDQELIEMERRLRQLSQQTFLQSIQLTRQQANQQLRTTQYIVQQNIKLLILHLSQRHNELKMHLRQLISQQTTQQSNN